MREEIKNLWVEALRSGEFIQTRGQLEKDGRYSVLGILSILALLEGVCTYDLKDDGGRYDGRFESLSYNVMSWAGINDFLEDGAEYVPFILEGRETNLAALNDAGLSFEELALIIEEHWVQF